MSYLHNGIPCGHCVDTCTEPTPPSSCTLTKREHHNIIAENIRRGTYHLILERNQLSGHSPRGTTKPKTLQTRKPHHNKTK